MHTAISFEYIWLAQWTARTGERERKWEREREDVSKYINIYDKQAFLNGDKPHTTKMDRSPL